MWPRLAGILMSDIVSMPPHMHTEVVSAAAVSAGFHDTTYDVHTSLPNTPLLQGPRARRASEAACLPHTCRFLITPTLHSQDLGPGRVNPELRTAEILGPGFCMADPGQ